jgi:hypothetical protein
MVISDGEIREVESQARQILEDFSKALDNVDVVDRELIEVNGGFREEGDGVDCDTYFRNKMFNNAPNKNENNIIAEVKKW